MDEDPGIPRPVYPSFGGKSLDAYEDVDTFVAAESDSDDETFESYADGSEDSSSDITALAPNTADTRSNGWQRKCRLCGSGLKNENQLITPFREHHGSKELYKCGFCGRIIAQASNLRRHHNKCNSISATTAHANRDTQDAVMGDGDQETNVDGRDHASSPSSSSSSRSESNYDDDDSAIDNDETSFPDQSSSEDSSSSSELSNTPSPSTTARRGPRLIFNLRLTETGRDGWQRKCRLCGVEQRSEHQLLKHYRDQHQITALLKCTYCGRTFSQASNLVRHHGPCLRDTLPADEGAEEEDE